MSNEYIPLGTTGAFLVCTLAVALFTCAGQLNNIRNLHMKPLNLLKLSYSAHSYTITCTPYPFILYTIQKFIHTRSFAHPFLSCCTFCPHHHQRYSIQCIVNTIVIYVVQFMYIILFNRICQFVCKCNFHLKLIDQSFALSASASFGTINRDQLLHMSRTFKFEGT